MPLGSLEFNRAKGQGHIAHCICTCMFIFAACEASIAAGLLVHEHLVFVVADIYFSDHVPRLAHILGSYCIHNLEKEIIPPKVIEISFASP